MTLFTDQRYLLSRQYRDATRLEARIALHRRFSTNRQGLNRWLFDQLRLPAGARVLELGCGPGHLWRENAERIPDDWRVTLSDFSPWMLSQAKKNLSGIAKEFEFARIDAQQIPAEDGSFEAVIANFMLYHVPERQNALAEIRRVLAPGGCLYAATNGHGHMEELEPYYRRLDPNYRRMTEPFNLENALGQLEPHFVDLELHRYQDSLVVTEAEPLVEYILSTLRAAESPRTSLAELRGMIREEIDRQGAVPISKRSGLVVARRAA